VKIAITNTAALNTGDAAILFATVDILRQTAGPDLDVAVFDQQASAASRYYPDFDFHPGLFDEVVTWTGARWSKAGILVLLMAAAVWRSPLRGLWARLLPPRSAPVWTASLPPMWWFRPAAPIWCPLPHFPQDSRPSGRPGAAAPVRPLHTKSRSFPAPARDWLLRHVLRRAASSWCAMPARDAI